MRDDTRTNETVLNHLHAENAYGEQITSHLADLREKLYQEFLYSIHETDYTTPVSDEALIFLQSCICSSSSHL